MFLNEDGLRQIIFTEENVDKNSLILYISKNNDTFFPEGDHNVFCIDGIVIYLSHE